MSNPVFKALQALQEQYRRLDSYVQPWQKEMKVGDKFIQVSEEGGSIHAIKDDGSLEEVSPGIKRLMTIYGEIVEPDPEDYMDEFTILARCYSVYCPEGELGSVHRALFSARCSNEDWEMFKKMGWPNISQHAQEIKDPKQTEGYDGRLPGDES